MTGDHGLSVFVEMRDIQTGPLTLLLTSALSLTPRNGFVACVVICAAVGLLCIRLLERSVAGSGDGRQLEAKVLAGGTVLLLWWPLLGGYGHLDDAALLALAVGAVCAVRADRRLLAGALIGIAIGFKPWAVALAPMLLDIRGWARFGRAMLAGALGAAIAAACWLPFIVADPSTMSSLRPTVLVARDSVLDLLDAHQLTDLSSFRSLQLLLMFAVGLIAVWRRGVEWVILVVVAARLATDPGTWSYYAPGAVLGALTWDLLRSQRVMPYCTIVTTVMLAPSWLVPDESTRAALRLILGVGITVLAGARPDDVRRIVGRPVVYRSESPESVKM